MSDILLTKNHIIHSIKDEQGNRDIFYAQNTMQDVLIDEDATEDIRGHIMYYGVCGTAANDAHKTISVVDGKANVLKNGVQLNITFTNGNSVAPIMLSVNGSPEYTIEGVMESSIVVNQTMILIFTGTSFITGGSGGVSITKEEVLGKDPNCTRYLSFVDGVTGNADFKIDEKVKITKEGLETEVGNSTVDFPVDNPQLTTDVRASYTPAPKETFKVIMKKIRHIIDALGKLAFKDSVGTSELNQQLKDHYNLTVHKNGSINGSSVNDLYNGTDYNGTVGVKSLDAKVGKTLQDQITSLNSKITSFNDTKSRIIASALGQARGMANTWTWEQVISNIESIVNRGNISHTFTPSGSEQSYTVAQGYHGGSGVVKCKAIALSGNAGTGDVLKGKTFYKDSLTKQTGTMPKYNTDVGTSVTTGWGISGKEGYFWIYIPTAGYYEKNHWLEVPFDTCAKNMYNACYRKINIGKYVDPTLSTTNNININITSAAYKSSARTCEWFDGSWNLQNPNAPVGDERSMGQYYWITVDFNPSDPDFALMKNFQKHELFGGAWQLQMSKSNGDTDYWTMNPNGKCVSGIESGIIISQWAMTPKSGFYYENGQEIWYDTLRLYLPVRYPSAYYAVYLYMMLTGDPYISYK